MTTSFYDFLFDHAQESLYPSSPTSDTGMFHLYNMYIAQHRLDQQEFEHSFFELHNADHTTLNCAETLQLVKQYFKERIKDINYAIAHPYQDGYHPRPRSKKGISKDKKDSKEKKEVKRGVYVLAVKGLPFEVYVGSSQNIPRRVEQHKKKEGAVCTTLAKGVQLLASIGCPKATGVDDLERKETLKQMHQRGIDKVRGWKFSTLVLSDEHKQQAFEDICCCFDLCLKCGETKHFVGECRSKTKARWCGGGPV